MSEQTVTEQTVSDDYVLNVSKRPWYEWILWGLWFVVLLFILQNALASGAELEPRAATIFWISFAVWLLAGVVVWFVRRTK